MTSGAAPTIVDLSGTSALVSVNRRTVEALTPSDFDASGDLEAVLSNLDSLFARKKIADEIAVIVPARFIRTRRISFASEIGRNVSNADFDELTRAAAVASAEGAGLAPLYRLPAAFLLDHQVTWSPPVGKAGNMFSIEFLDLSANIGDLGRIEKFITANDATLVDVLTPHEVEAMRLAQEISSGAAVHIGARDTVVSVIRDRSMIGAGSIAAGYRHLGNDLVAANLEDRESASRVVDELVADPSCGEDPRWPVLQARLEEIAGFAHQVTRASHISQRAPVVISGLGEDADAVFKVFEKIFPDGSLRLSSRPDDSGLDVAARDALAVPRITFPDETGNQPAHRFFRWLAKHL